MADIKISALTPAGALDGTEAVPIVQSSATVRTTTQAIADLAGAVAPAVLVESGLSAKISALSVAGALAGTEPLAIVQSGATVSTTVQDVANLAATGMSVTQQAGTTYGFVLADAGTYIQFTNGSSITATIPTNASQAFAIGTTINIEQNGGGVVTIMAAGGVTLHSNGSLVDTNGQYAVASLVKVASDTWTLFGLLA